MFGIGLPELILIMAVALIVVGPDKLPDLAKTLARQLLELKKATQSIKDGLMDEETKEPQPWERLPQPPEAPKSISDVFEHAHPRSWSREGGDDSSDEDEELPVAEEVVQQGGPLASEAEKIPESVDVPSDQSPVKETRSVG